MLAAPLIVPVDRHAVARQIEALTVFPARPEKRQADRVSTMVASLFKRLYPKWAGAAEWPSESLLEAWKERKIVRKEISGIINATFGVPPDVVVYTITTRDQCVPDASRGNPFQRLIC